MNHYEPLGSQLHLIKDMSIIQQLELKHKHLEDRILNNRKTGNFHKFKPHPSLFNHSNSDTVASCTPRFVSEVLPSSSTDIIYKAMKKNGAGFDTKRRAQQFHKLLHEKLSLIESSTSEKPETSEIGDCYKVSQRIPGNRFQNCRPKSDDTSVGSASLSSDEDFEPKSSEIVRKNKVNAAEKNKKESHNQSAASKTTSGGERRSVASRLSSQKSHCPKGIPGCVFEKKFSAVVTKSLKNIEEIRKILSNGILPPDGEEEESRRMIRVKEFSNRFSRNYLYPLARQMKDLSAINELDSQLINQKLLSTYQILQHALRAYQAHLPSTIGDCTYNQLKILLNYIMDVCGIHKNQLKEDERCYIIEFIETLKINAELAFRKIDECLAPPKPATIDSVLQSEQSRISLTKYNGKKPKNRGKNNKFDNRLSMYSTTASFRKDASWKRAVESLANKKFNVKSKYRTATYKHRPPLQKEETMSIPKLKSLFPIKSHSGAPKSTRLNSPVTDDYIKTMVEAQQNGESLLLQKEEWEKMEKKSGDKQSEDTSNKEKILIKLLQFTLKNQPREKDEENKSQLTEIIALIKNESNEDFLKKVLDGLGKENENTENGKNGQQLTLEIVQSACQLSEGEASSRGKTTRREPKITVSGDRNTRLICITDDNSLIEPPDDKNDVEDQSDQTNKVEVLKPVMNQTKKAKVAKPIITASSETQAHIKESHKASKGAQRRKRSSSLKIGRTKKTGRNLKPLDKKQAVDAIQYKLDFYRHCKNNPMYKRSTTCQPWLLMSKISEELLNQCLLAVAREIEVNDIVENIYKAELQL